MNNMISMNPSCSPAIHQAGWSRLVQRFSPTRLLILLTGLIYRWHMLAKERHQLRTLSDEMLKDIGITRLDAEREAIRPFWDDRGVWR